MKIIYDEVLINKTDFNISVEDRALLYGDGLFESIVVKGNDILYIDKHFSRLFKGMQVLQIDIPVNFKETIIQGIKQLLAECGFYKTRVRIQVWRGAGGRYTPLARTQHFLISAEDWTNQSKVLNKIGICESVSLNQSPTSTFKTISSLPYVLAGIEKEQRQLDELILLDNEGNLSEGSASNIFWRVNDVYFTPSLKTACIEGIIRNQVMARLNKNQVELKEVQSKKEVLKNADQIFFTNVSGIYIVSNYMNIILDQHLQYEMENLISD